MASQGSGCVVQRSRHGDYEMEIGDDDFYSPESSSGCTPITQTGGGSGGAHSSSSSLGSSSSSSIASSSSSSMSSSSVASSSSSSKSSSSVASDPYATYSGFLANSVFSSCAGCHSAGGAIDMSSYASVVGLGQSGQLLSAVTGNMSGYLPNVSGSTGGLSATKIIEDWIAANYPK